MLFHVILSDRKRAKNICAEADRIVRLETCRAIVPCRHPHPCPGSVASTLSLGVAPFPPPCSPSLAVCTSSLMASTKPIGSEPTLFDADDDEGWEDMPIVRESDEFADGLDEEDQKKYHYVPQAKKDGAAGGAGNATGGLLDIDFKGNEWRTKLEASNESEYTRLRMIEEDDADEVHLRTKYLFDEDKAMTPLSQMQQTKNMLTEMQRIAYVGLCALVSQEMVQALKSVNSKEMKPAIQNTELWALKILGRLYYHMELATPGKYATICSAL